VTDDVVFQLMTKSLAGVEATIGEQAFGRPSEAIHDHDSSRIQFPSWNHFV
jgi:hypothetical protein